MIFCLGFLVMQFHLHDDLNAAGLVVSLPSRGRRIFPTAVEDCQVPFVPPAYMDDVAIPLKASNSVDLLAVIQAAAYAVVRIASAYGMEINFSPGKTEVVVVIAGPRAVEARGMLTAPAALGDDGISILKLEHLGIELRVVPAYKHLGIKVSGRGGVGQELASRAASSKAAHFALARSCLAKAKIPEECRAAVASACVHSRALHQCGSWGALTSGQWDTVEAMYYRPLRVICGVNGPPMEGCCRTSNVAVHLHLRVVPVHWAVVIARLNLAARISTKGPAYLTALLQGRGGADWRQALIHSCRAMKAVLRWHLSELEDPALAPESWETFWITFPGQWRGLVKKLKLAALGDPALARDVLAAIPELAPAEGSSSDDEGFLCGLCEKTFGSAAAARMHCSKVHGTGFAAFAQQFIGSSICPGCGTDFHSRPRCIRHLAAGQGKASCRDMLLAGGFPLLEPEEAAAAMLAEQAHRAATRRAGLHELTGPPCRKLAS